VERTKELSFYVYVDSYILRERERENIFKFCELLRIYIYIYIESSIIGLIE